MPTESLFTKYAAYSAMKATTRDSASIFCPMRPSRASLRARTCPSISWTAFSARPLLPLLATGLSSTMVRQPGSSPRSNTRSLTKHLIAGSWSVFKMMSPSPFPQSQKYSITLSAANFPFDPFDGRVDAIVIPVERSRPTRMVIRWSRSSPGKQ